MDLGLYWSFWYSKRVGGTKDNDGFANIYEDENINAAKAETVVKLAKSLNCIVEALMEVV